MFNPCRILLSSSSSGHDHVTRLYNLDQSVGIPSSRLNWTIKMSMATDSLENDVGTLPIVAFNWVKPECRVYTVIPRSENCT